MATVVKERTLSSIEKEIAEVETQLAAEEAYAVYANVITGNTTESTHRDTVDGIPHIKDEITPKNLKQVVRDLGSLETHKKRENFSRKPAISQHESYASINNTEKSFASRVCSALTSCFGQNR